eukprot:GILK01013038.1.p1 GENE.GILK01013038.1~~GILK01013038.1.p1  ORF type:complete len:528 (+),score=63.43 GILK01013038.1:1-1584(+)
MERPSAWKQHGGSFNTSDLSGDGSLQSSHTVLLDVNEEGFEDMFQEDGTLPVTEEGQDTPTPSTSNASPLRLLLLRYLWRPLHSIHLSITKYLAHNPLVAKWLPYLLALLLLLLYVVVIARNDWYRLVSLLGMFVLMFSAYLLCPSKRDIKWKPVIWGCSLQFFFAVLVLYTTPGFIVFDWLGGVATSFLDCVGPASEFIFGPNYEDHFFAFKLMPTVVFFSSFVSMLYYVGVIQKAVKGIAFAMMYTLQTSGAESLSASANIFLGQTEAPLLIRPFIETLTISELHAVLTGGFATISGSLVAVFIQYGVPARYLLAASVMSAPASLAISKLVCPETEQPVTKGDIKMPEVQTSSNVVESVVTGAVDGLKLAGNIIAMMIAFIALMAVCNGILSWIGTLFGADPGALSIELLLSYLFLPVAFFLGVPINDCRFVSLLLGKKVIFNEFIAYVDLKDAIAQNLISERTVAIATFALCGFGNISSMGVQIGGIGGMAPSRQSDTARIILRAMIAGNLACFMTANIAGMLL